MIDWTKPIQRKDGWKVRFIGELNREEYPIIVAYLCKDGKEIPFFYPKDGRYEEDKESEQDIINVPETHEGWINIYQPYINEEKTPFFSCSDIFRTRLDAMNQLSVSAELKARIKVTWKDGDGL